MPAYRFIFRWIRPLRFCPRCDGCSLALPFDAYSRPQYIVGETCQGIVEINLKRSWTLRPLRGNLSRQTIRDKRGCGCGNGIPFNICAGGHDGSCHAASAGNRRHHRMSIRDAHQAHAIRHHIHWPGHGRCTAKLFGKF